MRLTPSQQATFTKAVIEKSGGDSSKVSLSYVTAARSRSTVRSEIASTAQKSWIAPQYATVHWDSKLMSNPNKHVLEERLVVAVGDNKSVSILGVPAY